MIVTSVSTKFHVPTYCHLLVYHQHVLHLHKHYLHKNCIFFKGLLPYIIFVPKCVAAVISPHRSVQPPRYSGLYRINAALRGVSCNDIMFIASSMKIGDLWVEGSVAISKAQFKKQVVLWGSCVMCVRYS